jgi:hypothetical protein
MLFDEPDLDILLEAYELLIDSYFDLLKKNIDIDSFLENNIRDILVKTAKTKKRKLYFYWGTEMIDIENDNCRIDIKLITPRSLEDDKIGIEIECKIINTGREYIDSLQTNNRKISPTNGIMSFIRGKYAIKMNIAGMIGFVKNNGIDDKIKKIKERIKKSKDIKTKQNLNFFPINKTFKYSYKSCHKRMHKLPEIDIYHLFLNFTSKK